MTYNTVLWNVTEAIITTALLTNSGCIWSKCVCYCLLSVVCLCCHVIYLKLSLQLSGCIWHGHQQLCCLVVNTTYCQTLIQRRSSLDRGPPFFIPFKSITPIHRGLTNSCSPQMGWVHTGILTTGPKMFQGIGV